MTSRGCWKIKNKLSKLILNQHNKPYEETSLLWNSYDWFDQLYIALQFLQQKFHFSEVLQIVTANFRSYCQLDPIIVRFYRQFQEFLKVFIFFQLKNWKTCQTFFKLFFINRTSSYIHRIVSYSCMESVKAVIIGGTELVKKISIDKFRNGQETVQTNHVIIFRRYMNRALTLNLRFKWNLKIGEILWFMTSKKFSYRFISRLEPSAEESFFARGNKIIFEVWNDRVVPCFNCGQKGSSMTWVAQDNFIFFAEI